MIEFSIRRLLRHWSLNLCILLGLTLGSALLAGLPSYSMAIAEWSLEQSFLSYTSTQRNIELDADPSVLTGALNSYIMQTIGDIVEMRLIVQNTGSLTRPGKSIKAVDETERLQPQEVNIWSFDRTEGLLRLVEGSWPMYEAPYTQQEIQAALSQAPELQAVVTQRVAEEVGIRMGDLVTDMNGYKYSIVGIIEQIDPGADIWWDDPDPFRIAIVPGINEDHITLPLIVSPIAIEEYFDRSYERTWRLLIDHSQITAESSPVWEERLLAFKTLLQADNVSMATSLPDILWSFRTNQATIRMVLLLTGTQSFIFVLYTLALLSSAVLERSVGEITTLAGRGASSWQLARMLTIEAGYMVLLVGCVLGPLLAWLALNGWSRLAGSSLSFELTPETLYYSLAGAGLGWVSLMVGTVPMVRHSLLHWQQKLSRPERRTVFAKLYLDIFLAVVAGVLFWQLSSSGTFVIRRVRELPMADPLLLLSPTLLLIAISLLLLRIFPYVLQAVAWLAQSMRGIVVPLGLARLARSPVRPNQIILLIGVAFGMMLFMTTYDTSLVTNQRTIAQYQAGADLRIAPRYNALEDPRNLPGVEQVSRVIRLKIATNSGRILHVMAIDPQTFPQVASFPEGMNSISMETIAQALLSQPGEGTTQNPSGVKPDAGEPLAAVYSREALPAGKGIGDVLQMQIKGKPVSLVVRGVISDFPTVNGEFILVDSSKLLSYLEFEPVSFYSSTEYWLDISPDQHESLAVTLASSSTILANAETELIRIRNNAFTEGTRRAFILNAYTLAILSIAGFILLNYFSAQQRLYEFSILRAHGMTISQMNILLASEGILLIVMGLIVGAGIGLGLVYSMRAFLNTALVRSFPGAGVYQVLVDWTRIGSITGILLAAFLLAIILFMIIIIKNGIHRTIKIGEE